MSEEEFKNSPWYTAQVGDVLIYPPSHRVVITKIGDNGFSWRMLGVFPVNAGTREINNVKYEGMLKGWRYDETVLAKKILASYEV
jgi:hypothetical protein